MDCPTCTGGNGVTLVFTGSPFSKIGGPVINGNATVTLTAPSRGLRQDPDYDGILFFVTPGPPATAAMRR